MPKITNNTLLLQISLRYCKSLCRLIATGEVKSIYRFCIDNGLNPDRLTEVVNFHIYGKDGRYKYVQIQDICALLDYGVSLNWIFRGAGHE